MDQVALPLFFSHLSCAGHVCLLTPPPSSPGFSREADRVILTRCQQDGANQNTFQAISSLLGNKTPNEVLLSAPVSAPSLPADETYRLFLLPPAGILPFPGFDGFVSDSSSSEQL